MGRCLAGGFVLTGGLKSAPHALAPVASTNASSEAQTPVASTNVRSEATAVRPCGAGFSPRFASKPKFDDD